MHPLFSSLTNLALALLVTASWTLPSVSQAQSRQGGGAFVNPSKPDKPKRATPAPRSYKCLIVTVTAPNKDANGLDWDSTVRKGPLPDIQLSERRTGFVSSTCDDSLRCDFRVAPSGNTLDLHIVDYDDFKANELIGAGTCSAKPGSCRLGLASLRLRAC